jgi:excisionase family DNA binding protein
MQQQGMPAGAAASAASAAVTIPELLAPPDVAKVLGVPESDVMTIIESGELPAKRIGASYRVKRSALDEYLAR